MMLDPDEEYYARSELQRFSRVVLQISHLSSE
jgi:hypothetical protein